jgi:diguanylate cyclase (GGDEF)-like protein
MNAAAPATEMPARPPTAPAWRAALAVLLTVTARAREQPLTVKDMASGRLAYANDAMAALLGRPAAELEGRTDQELFEGPLATALRAADQTAAAQAEPLLSEHRFTLGERRCEYEVLRVIVPSGDGGSWLAALWTDLAPERARQVQLRAALEQIEQQQRANEALRRELADQALRDAASGLYSRAHFEDQLKREVDLSTREHREFALVFVQLDPLSDAVRAMGEPALARILEAAGRLLRSGTRAMDASCRYDDERFAVLLSGVGLATAHSRMEGLRRQCATQIVVHEGQEMRFTVAMGVASFPHTAHSQAELAASCEAALQEARRRGGNHVTLAAIRFEPQA